MKSPCNCGADDCRLCFPEHFSGGLYLNPEHWCDVCQRFTGAVTEVCIWCGRQVCAACEGEHRETCGKGEE